MVVSSVFVESRFRLENRASPCFLGFFNSTSGSTERHYAVFFRRVTGREASLPKTPGGKRNWKVSPETLFGASITVGELNGKLRQECVQLRPRDII